MWEFCSSSIFFAGSCTWIGILDLCLLKTNSLQFKRQNSETCSPSCTSLKHVVKIHEVIFCLTTENQSSKHIQARLIGYAEASGSQIMDASNATCSCGVPAVCMLVHLIRKAEGSIRSDVANTYRDSRCPSLLTAHLPSLLFQTLLFGLVEVINPLTVG